MRPPLSACVIVRDECEELQRCLASIEWVDEICVVVDSRTRDGSEEVARRLAQRVEKRPYAGDVEQKSHCVDLASHDWVLIIDPDESVTMELARAIECGIERAGEGVVGFELNRITWHLGRWIRHGDFYPDWKLRVFRRSRAHWIGENPYGRVVVDGPVDRLSGHLEHRSYRDLSAQIDRIQLFSEYSAQALAKRGRIAKARDLWLRPAARFFRAYVLARGILDGVPGFVIASATAFHVFLKYGKLWELQHVVREGECGKSDR